jgi:hypothetical protein
LSKLFLAVNKRYSAFISAALLVGFIYLFYLKARYIFNQKKVPAYKSISSSTLFIIPAESAMVLWLSKKF